MSRDISSAVAAARLWAASKAPYLASALFACSPVATPDTGTVAVDPSWRLYVDPEIAARMDAPGFGRLLLHLVGHLVREHGGRASALRIAPDDGPWWQRCTDAEINDDLAAEQLLPSVAADLPADLGAPAHQLAERYFALRPAKQVRDSSGSADWDCGSGADGLPRPWDGSGDAAGESGLTGDQADRLRHRIAEELRQQAARQPGSVPGGWLRWAETIAPSRTDWRRVLAAEVRRAVAAVAGSVDYTYRRPSRRSHTETSGEPHAVLPSLYRPVPEVAVVCDTSGSMGEDLLSRALAELDGILTRAGLRSAGLAALAVDTEVHDARRIRRAAQVKLAGGGGTDMGAGIAAALARRPRPELIVVLTDGFTPWPDEPPRGVRVVVGLLRTPFEEPPPQPPSWARTVEIDEPAWAE